MIIYLDIDGVLADCHMSALRHYGLDLSEYPKGKRVKDVLEDNNLDTEGDYQEFWDSFDEDFWATLPQTEEFPCIIGTLSALVGINNIYLASRPTLNPESASGKTRWVQDNLPQFTQRLILIQDKYRLATPQSMLIDDSSINCQEFREVGGHAFLMPRPWNGHDEMSLLDLSEGLRIALMVVALRSTQT